MSLVFNKEAYDNLIDLGVDKTTSQAFGHMVAVGEKKCKWNNRIYKKMKACNILNSDDMIEMEDPTNPVEWTLLSMVYNDMVERKVKQ